MRGYSRLLMALLLVAATFSARAANEARKPLYYQDPGGAPFYAGEPNKAPDGRDYVYLRRALLSSQWFGDDGVHLEALGRDRLGVGNGLP